MEGYKNERQWVDLSNLPRQNNGKHIDWKNSVGYSVMFQYEKITGKIDIVDHKTIRTKSGNNMVMVSIVIDKYMPEPTYVYTKVLRYCELKNIVHNKIADVSPHIVQYLENPQDAYKFSCQSDERINTKCPICGHIESKIVGGLCRNGFYCPICSDHISIPNKLMYNILTQLHINFIKEVGQADFKWMQRYFYDFYFQTKDGQNVLIEMDGGLHNRLEEQQKRDKIKNNLARKHNFKLIRIDCDYRNAREKTLDYIKTNILNSELSSLLCLENIDWNQCKDAIKNNIMLQICHLWETDKYSSGDIVKTLNLHRTTVCTYLKRGHDLGLCPSYNTKESLRRRKKKQYKMIENIEVVKGDDM